jgi:hypothetical protein
VKLWTGLLAFMALVGAAVAPQPEPTLQQTIEKFIYGGFREGFGNKQIRRGGDSSAVAVTKVVSDRVLNDDQIEDALYILDMAFSDPGLIESPPDWDPKTALFVLRYLDLSTHDAALKAKIEQTRKHVTMTANAAPR